MDFIFSVEKYSGTDFSKTTNVLNDLSSIVYRNVDLGTLYTSTPPTYLKI